MAALWLATALAAGAAAAQGTSPTLARIKAAKAINVAYSPDSAPFSSVSGNAAPQGYSIELCKRAIAQIARALGEPELKVNWMAGSVTERLQMVAGGRAELECANTTQTQTRLASVDFSNLIFIDGGGLLVKAGAPINRIADLAGKRVAVLKGTTTQTRLTETLRAAQHRRHADADRRCRRRPVAAGSRQRRRLCRRQGQADRAGADVARRRRAWPWWPRTCPTSPMRWRCRATIRPCGWKSTRR